VTVRWASTGPFGENGLAFVESKVDSLNGLSAGTYTLSVDGAPSKMSLVVVPSADNPTSTVIVDQRLGLTVE